MNHPLKNMRTKSFVTGFLALGLVSSFAWTSSSQGQDLLAPLDVVEMPALPIDGPLATGSPLLGAPALSAEPSGNPGSLPSGSNSSASGSPTDSGTEELAPFSGVGSLAIEDRPAPGKMVVDEISLLRPEERWSLEESLINLRNLRNIHVYAVAIPDLEAGTNGKEFATRLGEKWAPEDAPCFGVILYTPSMTFPAAGYGGTVLASANSGYAGRVITEAMARGTAHPTTASTFQACSLELLEELEILLNKYEFVKMNGGESGGDPQSAESHSQATSSKISGLLKGKGGPGGRLRRFLPWILGGLLGLLLLACIPLFLWRKSRRSNQETAPANTANAYQEQQPQAPTSQQPPPPAAQPAGSIYEQQQAAPPQGVAATAAPQAAAMPPQQAVAPSQVFDEPPQKTEASFGRSSGSGNKECIFPSIDPEYRLQSPFAGGNNILGLFDGSGRSTPALPSRPLTAPEPDFGPPPTSSPPAETPAPAPSKDDDENDLFVY